MLSGSWQFTRKDEDKAENGLATQQIHLNLSMPLFDLAGGVISGSVSTDYGNRGYMQTGTASARNRRRVPALPSTSQRPAWSVPVSA